MTRQKYKISKKDPAIMSAAQINKELDGLDETSSILTSLMIELGRGHELFSETRKKYGEDWLSTTYCDVVDRFSSLLNEIERRVGSRMYRLPRGFGPIKVK
jgi:hypothetical protein